MKIQIACSVLSRLRGLLGRNDFPGVLLLTPCNDVHTFGMRRAIDIAFIASDGTVIQSHRAVGARRRIRCKRARATLERLSAETPWLEQGDRIDLKRLVHESIGE